MTRSHAPRSTFLPITMPIAMQAIRNRLKGAMCHALRLRVFSGTMFVFAYYLKLRGAQMRAGGATDGLGPDGHPISSQGQPTGGAVAAAGHLSSTAMLLSDVGDAQDLSGSDDNDMSAAAPNQHELLDLANKVRMIDIRCGVACGAKWRGGEVRSFDRLSMSTPHQSQATLFHHVCSAPPGLEHG